MEAYGGGRIPTQTQRPPLLSSLVMKDKTKKLFWSRTEDLLSPQPQRPNFEIESQLIDQLNDRHCLSTILVQTAYEGVWRRIKPYGGVRRPPYASIRLRTPPYASVLSVR